MLFHILPIYGNGWSDGIYTIEEPPPFYVDVEEISDGNFVGHINSSDPDFNGCRFTASLRYANEDITFNCQILRGANVLLEGYCMFEGR